MILLVLIFVASLVATWYFWDSSKRYTYKMSANHSFVIIEVDDEKKGMIGAGFTSIKLTRGKHDLRLYKMIDKASMYEYKSEITMSEHNSSGDFILKKTLTSNGEKKQKERQRVKEQSLKEVQQEKLAQLEKQKIDAQKRKITQAYKAKKQKQKRQAAVKVWQKSFSIPTKDIYVDSKNHLAWENSYQNKKKIGLLGAKHYCQNLKLSAHDNWSLPTKKQLQKLFKYKQKLKLKASNYWSSDVIGKGQFYVWAFDMQQGKAVRSNKKTPAYLRCVKSAY